MKKIIQILLLNIMVLISIKIYAQKQDTIFIKNEPQHKIFLLHNAHTENYNYLTDFNGFDTLEYNDKISAIGLPSKFVEIHKYNGKYVLYKPCDLCYHTTLMISNQKIQFHTCEITAQKLLSIKKIKNNYFKLVYNTGTLEIKLIDSKWQIFELVYHDDLFTKKYLMIDANKCKVFDILVNDCYTDKTGEITFSE